MDPDLLLLTRWRDGDRTAGNELFRRHFPSIRRFFENKVSAVFVEDLVQRTFTGCLESMPRFAGQASFRTFLFSIARRRLYSHLRESFMHERRNDVDMRVSSVRDLGQSPSSAAAAREAVNHVRVALQSVPTESQLILELYYWEEMTGRQIAEVLGVNPVTVRTRLHRARAALKDAMAAQPKPVAGFGGIENAMRSSADSSG